MIILKRQKNGTELHCDETEQIRLCPRCGMPSRLSSMYCEVCMASLQTPRGGHSSALRASDIIMCKSCGWYSPADAESCANRACGLSFSNAAADLQSGGAKTIYIKVCPQCRHENPAASDTCLSCGADISLAVESEKPAAPSADTEKTDGQFSNLATHQAVDLCKDERRTIGSRGFLSEQLTACDFVSREHADIFFRDGQWCIRDHSRNGTYLNGIRIERDVDTPLKPETIVSLGDPSTSQTRAAHFRFVCRAD